MSALVGPVLDQPGELLTALPAPATVDRFLSTGDRRAVQRTALLAELLSIDSTTLVTLCAPPGYGKSTVLAQWAEVDHRPFPWLTLTEAHNDRARLLGDLAAVTASLHIATAPGLRLLPEITPVVAPDLAGSAGAIFGQIAEPFVLVLDDAQVLTDGWAVIADLIASVPTGSLIAIASSRVVPVRAITRRQRRRAIEFTDRDLAFDDDEAQVVLGPQTKFPTVRAIVDRVEGWPVGVSLSGAGNPRRAGGPRSSRTSGHDVREYVHTAVLGGLDEATRAFLTHTAVLEELSGPLCDAVCDSLGSALLLRGRLSDKLLVTALPGNHRYRLHRLVRRALLDDLRLREPTLIPELNLRASRWFAAHGELDAAIAHAKLAGDMTQLGGLIWPNVQQASADGGIARLQNWLADLTDDQLGGSPDLIMAVTWLSVLTGCLDDSVRWQTLAEAREGRHWRSAIDGSERRGVLTLLRAWRGTNGLDDSYANSCAAFAALPADSVWRPSAGALSGMVLAWSGRGQEAGSWLLASEELARAVGNPAARADALAALGCLAFEEGDQPRSQRLILQASTVLLDHQLIDIPTSAFAVSVVAVGLARAGRSAEAAAMLVRSLALTEAVAGFLPWLQLNNRILQIDTCVLIGDITTARRLARQADDLLHRLGSEDDVSPERQAGWRRVQALLARLPVDPVYGSLPFTLAEFRIMQLLPTHLSFPEIGALLFNSRHTVKTQALAVYRKLGATSRNDAVERARALGFLPPMVVPDSLVSIHGDNASSAAPGHRYALVPSHSGGRTPAGNTAQRCHQSSELVDH